MGIGERNTTIEQKTKVIYETFNPYSRGVTHISIQSSTNPPYVWSTYRAKKESDLPILPNDIVTIPIEAARRLFDFKPGKLENIR